MQAIGLRAALILSAGAVTAALLALVIRAGTSVAANEDPPPSAPLTIEVIGHQWWWQIRYLSEEPSRNFTTANEIHIPVGQTVRFRLISADVIHSFWVPALGGKTDLIPGQTNIMALEAIRPGVFRGQCAEFCGIQHANMALVVVALEPDAFRAWWDAQLNPPPPITSQEVKTGETAFVQKCGLCHAVRGTRAGGIVGPDLSHLMQRRTIAAGTLPNNIGYLAAWIADPQRKKPGNIMPKPDISAAELQQIITYLQTLR
jgi:cytochrome c oxidase subunit II